MYRLILITFFLFNCKMQSDDIKISYNSFFANNMSDSYRKKEGIFKDGFDSILKKGKSYVSSGDSIWILPPPFIPEDTFFYVFIKKNSKIKVQNIHYNLDNHEKYKIEIKDINQDGKKDFIIETTYWMSGDTTLYKKLNSYIYENGKFTQQLSLD